MTRHDRWLLPDGIEELLPGQAAKAEQLRREVLNLFDSWGYQLVMPPLVEFTDSLLVGVGEDLAHHSFRLTDQLSGKPMAIRPDITSQVARIDAHSMQSEGVNRLCYAGSVLHALPKSLTASRCPILAGAEIYGNASIDADIEVVMLMLEMLAKVGDANIALTLDIGHISIYRFVEEAIAQRVPDVTSAQMQSLFDIVQRKSVPDLQALLPGMIEDASLREVLLKLPTLCGDVSVLEKARKLFAKLGDEVLANIEAALQQIEMLAAVVRQCFPSVNVYLDLAELRGYEYHTGLVFAAYAEGFGTALANGGRYDDLGKVFGRARPATGFNTDIKNLIGLLTANTSPDPGKVAIAAPVALSQADFSEAQTQQLWAFVAELRASGEQVIFVDEQAMAAYSRFLVNESGEWQLK